MSVNEGSRAEGEGVGGEKEEKMGKTGRMGKRAVKHLLLLGKRLLLKGGLSQTQPWADP